MSNKNLSKARKAKNDEFYTLYGYVEKEVAHYKDHLKGKVIYCNCDDPNKSNFWKYFVNNYEDLGLKGLISTYYNKTGKSHKTTYDGKNTFKMELQGDGDFRNSESIEILKEADIIITNPPFSLFREYVTQLVDHKKDFLIIGNLNALTYKSIFPLIKDNIVWVGVESGTFKFIVPEDYNKGVISYDEEGTKYASMRNILWYTTMDHSKRHKPLELTESYYDKEYL